MFSIKDIKNLANKGGNKYIKSSKNMMIKTKKLKYPDSLDRLIAGIVIKRN
jgi:hypothetical protein